MKKKKKTGGWNGPPPRPRTPPGLARAGSEGVFPKKPRVVFRGVPQSPPGCWNLTAEKRYEKLGTGKKKNLAAKRGAPRDREKITPVFSPCGARPPSQKRKAPRGVWGPPAPPTTFRVFSLVSPPFQARRAKKSPLRVPHFWVPPPQPHDFSLAFRTPGPHPHDRIEGASGYGGATHDRLKPLGTLRDTSENEGNIDLNGGVPTATATGAGADGQTGPHLLVLPPPPCCTPPGPPPLPNCLPGPAPFSPPPPPPPTRQ